MKPLNNHRSENGQILLILTVGIVALLGFLALAVDGGMIYADRRFDQNAADASSFAGAGAAAIELQNGNVNSNNFTCVGAFNDDLSPKSGHILYTPINNAINAALQRAASNNFTIQYPLANQHGVEIICNSSGDKYLEVRTVISSNVRTAFAHLFYKGDVRNTVEAVARAATAFSVNAGGSLTHLSTDCKTPLRFDGGGSSTIKFDGAYSNGCIDKNGQGTVTSASPVYYLEECLNWPLNKEYLSEDGCPLYGPGDTLWDGKFPKVNEGSTVIPKYYLEDENSGGAYLTQSQVDDYWDAACPKGPLTAAAFESTGTLSPGRYTEFSSKKKGNTPTVVTLQSGLYCFDGNFDPGSGTTVQSAEGGVTIIMLGGSFAMDGGSTVKLTASQEEGYENLLLYGAKYNTKVQSFLGSSGSSFKGTIWFPDGYVELGGTTDINAFEGAQVIADRIRLHGSAGLNMTYNEADTFTFPSRVSLVK
jgi:hypothetical protein